MATLPVPSLEVPPFIAQPTGAWTQDVLPLITLVAGIPTLYVYWKAKRVFDFGVFSSGFFVAAMYHICYMHSDGLEAANFWGLDGSKWRTLDIILASFCLTRTATHALGAAHPLILDGRPQEWASVWTKYLPALSVITIDWILCLPWHITTAHTFPNLVFPGMILIRIYRSSRLELLSLTLGTFLALLMMKFLVEGLKTIPSYSKGTGTRIVGWALLGFVCFFLPSKVSMYWFWHSMWHIFIGLCYYELYSDLERDHLITTKHTKKKI